MTPFDLALCTDIRYSKVLKFNLVWLYFWVVANVLLSRYYSCLRRYSDRSRFHVKISRLIEKVQNWTVFENHLRKSHFAICELHCHIKDFWMCQFLARKFNFFSYQQCFDFVHFWCENSNIWICQFLARKFKYFHINNVSILSIFGAKIQMFWYKKWLNFDNF